MTEEQIKTAITYGRKWCADQEELIADPNKLLRYFHESARGLFQNRLGYSNENTNEILTYCYEKGFQYCLDPMFSATHFDPNNPRAVNDMVTDYPDRDACLWGIDQLRSRLDCVR